MSDNANATVEVAEEALEQKLENLTVSEDSSNNSDERARRRVRLPTSERIRIWEEEQKGKVVIKTGLKGTVKWYSVLGRYGFIAREEEGQDDVFVHQTAIAKSATNKFYLRTLGDGEDVVFDLVEGKKGPEAANVTGPDGENVMGSRFRHLLLSRFRNNRKHRSDAEEDVKKEENAAEESKKPKKQRKNRSNRKPRQEKAAGDATAEEIPAGDRRKVIDEPEQTKLGDHCGAAHDEPTLGAQAVDAQI